MIQDELNMNRTSLYNKHVFSQSSYCKNNPKFKIPSELKNINIFSSNFARIQWFKTTP